MGMCLHRALADLEPEFGGHMAYKGVWEHSLARGQGVEPPEAEHLFALSQPEESPNFSWNLFFAEQKIFVGRLGGSASATEQLYSFNKECFRSLAFGS